MKNKLIKFFSILALVCSLQMLSQPLVAQCPMCKMGAESNLKQGGTAGKGLNSGILYMFATPYLVVGSIIVLWWYYRKEDEADHVVEGKA